MARGAHLGDGCQGRLTSATYFWPGSEVVKWPWNCPPNLCRQYDGSVPFEERVDTVLVFVDLPGEQRPSIVTLFRGSGSPGTSDWTWCSTDHAGRGAHWWHDRVDVAAVYFNLSQGLASGKVHSSQFLHLYMKRGPAVTVALFREWKNTADHWHGWRGLQSGRSEVATMWGFTWIWYCLPLHANYFHWC
jgi:hypothetical protein